ncbi:MAG: hypothetical protein IKE17_15365 [Clostridia bacterium]|nr:hypothetical protein [Clostridia bacterium]MBR2799099.1 hypothetical protein [Clostridia bacterium]
MRYRPITSAQFDTMAHQIVNYLNSIKPLEDDGNKSRIFYNEDRLYTVHDREHGTVTLVVADSPREARDKVLKGVNRDV